MDNANPRHPLTDEASARTRERPCPPHGPILIERAEPVSFVATCLRCGLRGPEREDGWEAKLAFDRALGPYSPTSWKETV